MSEIEIIDLTVSSDEDNMMADVIISVDVALLNTGISVFVKESGTDDFVVTALHLVTIVADGHALPEKVIPIIGATVKELHRQFKGCNIHYVFERQMHPNYNCKNPAVAASNCVIVTAFMAYLDAMGYDCTLIHPMSTSRHFQLQAASSSAKKILSANLVQTMVADGEILMTQSAKDLLTGSIKKDDISDSILNGLLYINGLKWSWNSGNTLIINQ